MTAEDAASGCIVDANKSTAILDQVGFECLAHIMRHVSCLVILRAGCVCTTWRDQARGAHVWQEALQRRMYTPSLLCDVREELDWKSEAIAASQVSCKPALHLSGLHSDEVLVMAWAHHGRQLATASRDSTAAVLEVSWQPTAVRLVHQFRAPPEYPDAVGFSIAWSHCNSYIGVIWAINNAHQGNLTIFDVQSGDCLHQVKISPSDSGVAWLPGTACVSGRRLQWYRSANGTMHNLYELAVYKPGLTTSAIFARFDSQQDPREWGMNYRHMISVSHDGSLAIMWSGGVSSTPGEWGHCTCVVLRKTAPEDCAVLTETEQVLEHCGAVLGAALSPCGEYVLVNVRPHMEVEGKIELARHFELCLWQNPFAPSLREPSPPGIICKYKGHVAKSPSSEPFNVHPSFSPEGRFVASGSEDGAIFVWHRLLGHRLYVSSPHLVLVNCVVWCPTRPGAIATCSDDGTVAIWEDSWDSE